MAWKILAATGQEAWKDHWLALLERFEGLVPSGWEVLVLADRGLYAKGLFEGICTLGWHPLLRIKHGGKFRPHGSLTVGYHGQGRVLRRLGQHADAEQAFRQALTLRQELATDFPSIPIYRLGIIGCYGELVALFRQTGQDQEAEEAGRQVVAILEKLVIEFPDHPDFARYLRHYLGQLGLLLGQRGNCAEARRLLERSGDLDHRAGSPYHAACVLALCVPLVEKDESLAADKRTELLRFYADRAMNLLTGAVRKGFKDIDLLKKDAELDALRSRPDFQRLLAEVEAKAKK